MRIAVAMSGGVDSSVAALLLHREGIEVIGLSMHLWSHGRAGEPEESGGRCCTLDDLSTARRAAEIIGIPHYILNLEDEFIEAVVRPFAESYLGGETPIPCVACNTEVKFKALLTRTLALGCDAVATGHYARIERDPTSGSPQLLRAKDLAKDQSYFLHGLTVGQLERLRFPLGDLTKPEVRQIAREAGLPNWNKPDSQEICFIPKGKGPRDFILEEATNLGISLPVLPGFQPGPIVDSHGAVVGQHAGVFPFTVGQRRGLGISGKDPVYVVEITPENARVVVGPETELLTREVHLRDVNWLGVEPFSTPVRVLARVRSRHQDQSAWLETEPEGRMKLTFDEPVRAAAAGQSAVFYDFQEPERVLGGGTILVRGTARKER